ncbi:MAG: (deoxy)nucleoside triphosphate pyrophosphohydrolase [Candidatus Eiseniibacteriota bacterium]
MTAATGALRVAAAVIWQANRVLLTQRPPGGALALQWEFPGGKIDSGESPEQAVVRELHEELGVRATALERLGETRHRYAHGLEVELVFIRCALATGELRPSAAVHALRWAEPRTIDVRELLEADREFVRGLISASPGDAGPGTSAS